MATQNLVSASIPDALKASILQSLDELNSKLTFLVTLTKEDIKGLVKGGEGYGLFLDKAYEAVNNYPQILSPLFDKEEFKKDYLFASQLEPIFVKLNIIHEAVKNTLFAANSDTMAASLRIYGNVQDNKDLVPGLNTIANDMAKFFKRTRVAKEETK